MAYTAKKHIPREKGIPMEFPLKCYQPAPDDIPPYSPEILIGMDSGISNTAFSYIELVRDEMTNAVIDFKYGNTYYFKKELDDFSYKIDKKIYLANRYYDLFSHRNVANLTFEVLSLTSAKNEDTLKGVIDAQATTDMINTLAYQLNHPFTPVPATAIKYCMVGTGKATKYDMCMNAYAWTGDEELLYNDHMADAFSCCLYTFIQKLKESCIQNNTPIPKKFSYMGWNYKDMPSYLH